MKHFLRHCSGQTSKSLMDSTCNLPDILEENTRKPQSPPTPKTRRDKGGGVEDGGGENNDRRGGKLKRSASFKQKLKQTFSSKKRISSSPCLITLADSTTLNAHLVASVDVNKASDSPPHSPVASTSLPTSPNGSSISERRNRLLESKHATTYPPEGYHRVAANVIEGEGCSLDRGDGETGEEAANCTRRASHDDKTQEFERNCHRTRTLPLPARGKRSIVIRQHIIRSCYHPVSDL